MMGLHNWPKGKPAQIVKVTGEEQLVRRLSDLGVYEGVIVEVVGQAPLKGPLIIRFSGTTLALREGDAACIQVQNCHPHS